MLDLNQPDGTGKLKITSVSMGTESSTYHLEGPVQGYGIAVVSATLTPRDAEETRGSVQAEARVFGNDGTLITTPVCGAFRRACTSLQIYVTDACSNGDMNFVSWTIDLIQRTAEIRYWSLI